MSRLRATALLWRKSVKPRNPGIPGIAAVALLGALALPMQPAATTASAVTTASTLHARAALPSLPSYPDGTLIRGTTSPRVYAVYGGSAHWIATPTVLKLLGFAATPIAVVPQATVNALPKGGTFVERFVANGLLNPYSPIRTIKANIYTYPPSAAAGAVVTIKGIGFGAGEAVQLNLAGAIIFQARASVSGTIQTAIAVPATLPLGVYRLTAFGLQSRAFAIEPVTVIPATAHPTAAPSPSFAASGGAFTVSGSGFRPDEVLYLYDAQAYATSSVANAAGSFGPVSLLVPASVAIGVHTVWVYGVSSHYLATSSIAVVPPLPASVQASPTSVSSGALQTISGAGFVPGESVALTFGGEAAGQIVANNGGAFSGVITVPAAVHGGQVALTARGLTSGRAASIVVTVVALAPHLLVSPAAAAPGAALTLAGTGFAPGEGVTLALNGTALATTPAAIVADAQGNFFASTALPADAPSGPNTLEAIGARSRAAATASVDVQRPVASTWYFAGVDARTGADGRIAVLNPDNNPARLALHIAIVDAPARDIAVTVGGHSRATINLRSVTGRRALCFVRLSADRRVSAAATTWRGGLDWSSLAGVAATARAWYLPEGYTGGSFKEYLRVYNPGPVSTRVDVQLLPQRGRARTLRLTLAGDTGTEVFVHRRLTGQAVAAIVSADHGVVVDRAMTFGRNAAGSTESSGSAARSATWFFADGQTAAGFQTLYTVLNPNRRDPAAVTATFFSDRGVALGTRTVVVAPQRRATIVANGAVRSGGISAVLSSNVPVAAERVMYFGRRRGHAMAANVITGHSGGSVQWEFPEGNTRGNQEYLVLQGTAGTAATVGIEFYTTAGTAFPATVTVPPHGRIVVAVNGVPGLPAGEHGAILTATNGVPFLAEQSIYAGDGTRGDAISGIAQ